MKFGEQIPPFRLIGEQRPIDPYRTDVFGASVSEARSEVKEDGMPTSSRLDTVPKGRLGNSRASGTLRPWDRCPPAQGRDVLSETETCISPSSFSAKTLENATSEMDNRERWGRRRLVFSATLTTYSTVNS
ncbi:uncharacterized protein ARMOST_13563 [Armillaria ostoyae]|uniref:Uncharacterized protein n=1 Tax=Armillaria ostoyae TaxID=47428 RepID=A0A284RN36_ARMOS|nr:uncharacterized protein ARMOST_13563 [Armillaria ostoyae]